MNKYLLEDNLSVVGFCRAVTGVSREEVLAIVSNAAAAVGDESYTLFGYDPKHLYKKSGRVLEGGLRQNDRKKL